MSEIYPIQEVELVDRQIMENDNVHSYSNWEEFDIGELRDTKVIAGIYYLCMFGRVRSKNNFDLSCSSGLRGVSLGFGSYLRVGNAIESLTSALEDNTQAPAFLVISRTKSRMEPALAMMKLAQSFQEQTKRQSILRGDLSVIHPNLALVIINEGENPSPTGLFPFFSE